MAHSSSLTQERQQRPGALLGAALATRVIPRDRRAPPPRAAALQPILRVGKRDLGEQRNDDDREAGERNGHGRERRLATGGAWEENDPLGVAWHILETADELGVTPSRVVVVGTAAHIPRSSWRSTDSYPAISKALRRRPIA